MEIWNTQVDKWLSWHNPEWQKGVTKNLVRVFVIQAPRDQNIGFNCTKSAALWPFGRIGVIRYNCTWQIHDRFIWIEQRKK